MARCFTWVLAALLLTVSCSGGDQEGANPPPPPVVPSTTTPAPAAPATPFVSSADREGAFAFVRAYLEQLNRASATGDVAGLTNYRKPSCACKQFEQEITDVYARGGRIEGDTVEVLRLLAGESGPSYSKVTALIRSTPYTTVDASGGRSAGVGAEGDFYFLLTRETNRWVIDTFLGNTRPRAS